MIVSLNELAPKLELELVPNALGIDDDYLGIILCISRSEDSFLV